MLLLTLFLLASAEQTAVSARAEGPPAEPRTPPVAATVCIACRAEVAHPHELYSGNEWRDLRAGKILRKSERDHATAARSQAAGLIPRPPRSVWAVLTDFESWPSFMPHVKKTRVTRRDGPRAWVHQDFRILLLGMQHTTVYDLVPTAGLLGWRLDLEQEHDIAASEGRWQLLPLEEGRATLVRYAAAMDSGRAMPAFVEDLLLQRSLEGLLKGLRAEVLRRDSDAE